MLKWMIQIFFVIVGAVLGFHFGANLVEASNTLLNFGIPDSLNGDSTWHLVIYTLVGALFFFCLSFWAANPIINLMRWTEERLFALPLADVFTGVVGLILGLIVAYLLNFPFQNIPVVDIILPIFLAFILGYFGFIIGYKKREDISSILTLGKLGKDKRSESNAEHKILDTSVIIDGRIADICKTEFIEGTIVIPGFVLEELQHIADSSDVLKRNRGRRGLDILNRIQKELSINVQIYEGDFDDIHEVDSKLIRLAKVLNGKVVTNDFNLNKVCDLQGVAVLNINDLANAVKPVVLPGEELNVQVIKDGKEHGQGVAYLDDGTMIVIEEGRNYIGKELDVLVTSVLQTSAGRMIFAKPKLLERAL